MSLITYNISYNLRFQQNLACQHKPFPTEDVPTQGSTVEHPAIPAARSLWPSACSYMFLISHATNLLLRRKSMLWKNLEALKSKNLIWKEDGRFVWLDVAM